MMNRLNALLTALGLRRRDDDVLEFTAEQEEIYRLEEAVDKLLFEIECLEEENEALREVACRIPY